MRTLAVLFLLAASSLGQSAATPPLADNEDGKVSTITVPAGTKVLLALKNAVTTRSARPGDGVYLESTFPVAANNRILIPAGTYVQGSITSIKRAGRLKGKAEVLMHFTTLIFPNGYTVILPGALENVPGAERSHVKDKEGTVEGDSQTGEKAGTVGKTAATGAVVGGISHGGKGAAIGAGIGGAVGLAVAMLTRGQDVRLEQGTAVEMVLQRPLVLEEARLEATNRPLVPVQAPPPPERKPSKPVRQILTPLPEPR